MSQEYKQKIAEVFNRNLDSRLTMDLANGMLQSIFAIVEIELKEQSEQIKKEMNLKGPENVQPTDTDNG